MNKPLSLIFVLAILLVTNLNIFAQNDKQNIRTKRTTTTTTTTVNNEPMTTSNNIPKAEKDAFTLINGQVETHNFGNNIKVGNPVEHTFVFRNNGSKTMKIANISSSCGCTTPEWSKQPIAPNKTGSVKVRYNSAAVGKFYKSITLTFSDHSTKNLWIQGEVIK